MTILKYLAYYNIIYSLLLIWNINLVDIYGIDYFETIFIGLTIWYSWETTKQLKGIKNKLNGINLAIGISILIIGGLSILGELVILAYIDYSNNKNFLINLILLMILYIPSFLLVITTLKLFYLNKKLIKNK